ncbi:hypothetical protein FOQG_17539 [Fusarium oxysporum f. sp. raphani 54005]|uniref:Uncharacterized protein n=2 Tax=Fusarium oxysporum f. sp. raphani TaxID=96318 RepID=X0B6M2_FUSOX|nr:hypothetical protein FOQG_17539 [Fusarium oxysporum f. sp. raphani 54005]KAG7435023.1 hypothetical protein Forpi1262_v005405 [Fusarium oxysporum f. sp. raphani]
MAPYDFIAQQDIRDDRLAFARKLIDATDAIVLFIDEELGWNGTAKHVEFFKGSFNFSLRVKRGESGEHVVIRFPVPGNIYGPWRDEKVKNEVMAMKFIREHTSIPVPIVRHWGVTEKSPQQLGPFIIMDFIEGDDLSDLLQQPTENEEDAIVLDPNIDDEKLDFIYDQIAGFMLELSRLSFSRIGAISQDATSGQWAVNGRPLTYDMNEVVTLGDYPADQFATMSSFDRASDFFLGRAQSFQTHLEAQRNVAGDDEDLAWKQYVARHCYAELISTHGIESDEGPFRLFCDDLRPTNMLVNPETLQITAVLDLEFTNAMPAQFANDLPWWLLLKQPAVWVSDGKLQEFLDLFAPRKEQFLRAMKRAEARSPPVTGEIALSDRMRDSWESGRFWFNMASRCSFDVDEIYWATLHKEGLSEMMSERTTPTKKVAFLKRKKDQFDAYRMEKESDERFAK